MLQWPRFALNKIITAEFKRYSLTIRLTEPGPVSPQVLIESLGGYSRAIVMTPFGLLLNIEA